MVAKVKISRKKITSLKVRRGSAIVKAGFFKGLTDADTLLKANVTNFGTRDGKIPMRNFMFEAFNGATSRGMHRKIKAISAQLLRDEIDVIAAVHRLGVVGQNTIQLAITAGDYAPNAPSTVARKGSSVPLIDSGAMHQSVRYEVD